MILKNDCCMLKKNQYCWQLIKVNQPDLVLFVGEALVGNEAVDQLVKFNQALADHSSMDNPHLIDGIVLTKYDTIDDKVALRPFLTLLQLSSLSSMPHLIHFFDCHNLPLPQNISVSCYFTFSNFLNCMQFLIQPFMMYMTTANSFNVLSALGAP